MLGAAREVGRSGFLVDCNGTNLLLDYGVKLGRRGLPPKFPIEVRPKDLNAIIITHSHLDHSGFVPYLFNSADTNVYATPPTFDLSVLLIEDMLNIAKKHGMDYPFDHSFIPDMMKNAIKIKFKEKITVGNSIFELRDSGHVFGGGTVLVESENKRLFYTGDIKTNGSRMLCEADLDIGEIDLLITESTYSQKKQKPRKESERELIEFANDILDGGGTLFIPSFSIERSQEMACILKNANFKHRIIMDGMALKVNDIIFKYPEYLRDPKVFTDAINSATAVRSHEERKRIMKEPCVIISPAGMLVGGNAVYYLQDLAFDKKNGIALVSYQGEGTPGKKLLDTGKVSTRGNDVKVSAKVKQFEFSGHADRDELFDMLKTIKGNPKVLTVHGDLESCEKFAQEIHDQFGFEAHAPKEKEIVTI